MLKRLCIAVLFSLGLSAVFTLFIDEQTQSLLLRGDFPAFYYAARCLLEGRESDLYNFAQQKHWQNLYWPSLAQTFYAFAYPPYVAAVLSVFGFFGPIGAKMVFTALMCLLLWQSTAPLQKILSFRAERLVLFTAMLCLAPIFIGVLAGQNIALSILLYVLLMRSALFPPRHRPAQLGLCAGLWCFKPQFGAAAILGLLLARQTKALPWALGVAAFWYLLGAILQGPFWPATYWEVLAQFSAQDLEANGQQMISLTAFAHSLERALGTGDRGVLYYTAIILSLAIGLHLVYCFLLVRRAQNPMEEAAALGKALIFLGPGVALASPHTLFYDFGLFLPAMLVGLKKPSMFLSIIVLFVFALLRLLQQYLALEPLCLVGLGCYVALIITYDLKFRWPALAQTDHG